MATPTFRKLLIGGILCMGAIMTLVGSIGDAPTFERISNPGNHSLTDPEQAYLAYMVPRLDRLIEEVTAVSSLVDERSRNIIALQGYGNRITTLTSDIIEWDDENEVPDDFLPSHASLLRVAGDLRGLVDEAQGALLRLDFAGVGDMIPRFEGAVSTAQRVRDALPSGAGSPS